MLQQALAALKANDNVLAETLLSQSLSNPDERHGALRLMVRFCVNQNNLSQAIHYAEMLIQEHPEHTDYYLSLSQLYQLDYSEQRNQLLWQRYVQRWPKDTRGWFHLLMAARKNSQAETALIALQRWFELTGDRVELLFQQALINSELLHNEQGATALLQQLLALQPSHHAALFNLGHLFEQLGDETQATQYFYAACMAKPDDGTSWARWLELAKLTSAELQDYQRRFAPLLDAPASSAQIDLCYALGLCYDRLGLYSQAWRLYQKANQGDSRFLPAYRPEQTELIMKWCQQRQVANWPLTEQSTLVPILICGMFRSGSTLAEQILAASEQVASGGELEFLHRQLFALIPQPEALQAKAAEPEFLQVYLEQVDSIRQKHQYFTDKRPENFMYLDVIFHRFPAAKVIWTRRQLADNALSVYFHRLGPGMSYATNLDAILHYEQQQQRLMRHWQQRYPGQIFELDYDALVRQPDSVLRALFEFIGLNYSGEVERFYQLKHAVKTASVSQVRRPLYQHSSGRFRNYQADILQSAGFPAYCELISSMAADHKE